MVLFAEWSIADRKGHELCTLNTIYENHIPPYVKKLTANHHREHLQDLRPHSFGREMATIVWNSCIFEQGDNTN